MAEPAPIPVIETVNYIVNFLKVLVGGIFGFYVISFIYRIISARRLSKKIDKVLTEVGGIKEELAQIKKKGRKRK